MDLTRGPTGDELRAFRERHELTQAQCSVIVDCTSRQWQKWEAETPPMPRVMWWFLLLRLRCISLRELPKIPERRRRSHVVVK